jgi:O-methyltransferase involved in polyketide biosynthesis
VVRIDGMPTLPGAHPGARGLSWALAVRTGVFDDLLSASISDISADAVLNLAAGLDARPYRLSLPAHLTWIEADRPELLSKKADLFQLEERRPRATWNESTSISPTPHHGGSCLGI